jgi:HemK-related putative methylase
MNPLLSTVYRASLPIQRMVLRRRVRRLVLERVDGISLVVLPDVFNGVVFRTGALLARTVPSFPAPPRDGRPALALDMGTGTGLGALFAARAGYRVLAVDANPEAVRCATINALLNRLEREVEVRQGDLFAPVEGELFDLVLFNPPFFGGEPRDLHDLAWRGAGVFERFLEELPARLAPQGVALVVLSTHGDPERQIERLTTSSALRVQAELVRDYGSETITVFSARRR